VLVAAADLVRGAKIRSTFRDLQFCREGVICDDKHTNPLAHAQPEECESCFETKTSR